MKIERKCQLRRRGAAYALVLGVAMLVTVIGVSAILTARVELKGARGTQDVAAARFLAQSAIEYAHQIVNANANWRSTYTDNVWTSPVALGTGTIRFKLADSVNKSLTADPSAPVRLFGSGTVGSAIRIYSVKLSPIEKDAVELIQNGDIESGLSPWNCTGSCTLTVETTNPHGGKSYLKVSARSQRSEGPTQLLSNLKNGQNYSVEVWVSGGVFGGACTVKLFGVATGGSFSEQISDSWLLGGWHEVSGSLTPSWTGTLTSAAFQVNTANALTVSNFTIDDASLLVGDGQPTTTMAIVEGTWRREINE